MAEALLLAASDLRPLRETPGAISGAIDAATRASLAQHAARVRHQHVADIDARDSDGLRITVTAEDGARSGLRIFGNPPNTRAYLLLAAETRAMLALMDYGVLNSLRVGALGAVAARHLAPPGARTVGLIGAGWQAPTQLDGLRAVLPELAEVRVYSPTAARREAFARTMSARLGLPVIPVASAEAALAGADVVDLCAPGHGALREPLFEAGWIRRGALVISMAPNQCPIDFARGAGVVAASYRALTEPEAWPPFDRLIASGALPADAVQPLGAFVAGAAMRRPEDTIVYVLEGGAAADLFVASWAYDWALARGVGRRFDPRA